VTLVLNGLDLDKNFFDADVKKFVEQRYSDLGLSIVVLLLICFIVVLVSHFFDAISKLGFCPGVHNYFIEEADAPVPVLIREVDL